MALNSSDRSGCEWLIEARDCSAETLRSPDALRVLFAELVNGLNLHPVGETTWHQFAGTGGITGLALLEESHLACHTFPEYGALCLNVFCCRARPDCAFEEYLRRTFDAQQVTVRRMERHY